MYPHRAWVLSLLRRLKPNPSECEAGMGAIESRVKTARISPTPVDPSRPSHHVLWSSRFGRRSGALENAPPIIRLVKSLLDPIAPLLTLFLITYAQIGEVTGLVFCMGIMSVLLSGYLLNSRLLFLSSKDLAADVLALLIGWGLVVAIVAVIGHISGYAELVSLSLFVPWVVLTPVVLLGLHALVYWFIRQTAASQDQSLETVIVGANLSGQALAREIARHPLSRLKFLGYCDDREPTRLHMADASVLTGLAGLSDYVRSHKVARIYITLSMTSQARTVKLLDALKDTTASIYFVPDLFVFDCIQARFDEVGDIPVISVCESPFEGLSGLSKRVFDVLISTVILALIWPLLIAIGMAVKLTSPGPAIFVQRRYGLDGREIEIYKFRTMNVMEDGACVRQATRNDARLTPIGGFLRRTSLDELPQFINVLQGRMSVVGPRPHANTHNELYRRLIKGYMVRHKVRPGITGLAQVSGARGETDTLEKMERRIEFDLAYLREWSVWLDLKIILKTIVMTVGNREAY